MEEIDLKLFSYIMNNSKDMVRNDLYYLLINWVSKHGELEKELRRRTSKYILKYISIDGVYGEEIFCVENYSNPREEVFFRFNLKFNLNTAKACQIWYIPSPYEEETKPKFITSYGNEELFIRENPEGVK